MSPLGEGKAVTDVMDRLSSAISDFASYISSLPAQTLRHSKSAVWGAREVLIHLVFWHEQYVAITRALLAGKQLYLVTGTFKQANALAVETNRDESVSALLARLAAAQAELSRGYPAARSLTIAFKAGGKARRYDDAMARVEAHIREHLRKLKRQGKERRTEIARSCETHRGGGGHEK